MTHNSASVTAKRWRLGAMVAVLVGGLTAVAWAQPKDPPGKQPDAAKPTESKPTTKGDEKAKEKPKEEAKVSPYVLDFKVKTLDGKEQDLSAYKGKVVVIVNVASKCGYTPQYEGLEKLYQDNKDKGLVVLGFPADNFGHQEPGNAKEIREFCDSKYHVTFPLFEKISVLSEKTVEEAKGKKPYFADGPQHPLYQRLTAQPAPIGGDPKWNFTKFVVDRQGNVVARFDAARENAGKATLEEGLLKKVDELLKQK
jgi:glutathione peroxidase